MIQQDTVNFVETMWPSGYGPEWNSRNCNDPKSPYPDLDESDIDDVLPLGALRPYSEEEEWTIVGKSHSAQRYNKNMDCNPLPYTRNKLDRSGVCCKQLDYIDWEIRTRSCPRDPLQKTVYVIPLTIIRGRKCYRPDEMRRHEMIARHPHAR